MRREVPESDVTKHPDDTLEARRTGSPAGAPADVTVAMFQDLRPGCPAVRVAWSIGPDGETR
ncbi:hypothetical protein GCM10022252_34110 [Streptosporangium oxazolinicum]|uniref:Uncharacterized protein n=1 Tax=Streptosporangium oxazolinicum TaxID=909287 RepID=A0ABP8AWV5_9ACTN